jgi:hypothetical protein
LVTRENGFFSTHFSTQLLKSSKINLARAADCFAAWPVDCSGAHYDAHDGADDDAYFDRLAVRC